MQHNWTGNVRELKNLIERGVLIGKEPELTLQDLGIGGVARETESEQAIRDSPDFHPFPRQGSTFQQSKDLWKSFISKRR